MIRLLTVYVWPRLQSSYLFQVGTLQFQVVPTSLFIYDVVIIDSLRYQYDSKHDHFNFLHTIFSWKLHSTFRTHLLKRLVFSLTIVLESTVSFLQRIFYRKDLFRRGSWCPWFYCAYKSLQERQRKRGSVEEGVELGVTCWCLLGHWVSVGHIWNTISIRDDEEWHPRLLFFYSWPFNRYGARYLRVKCVLRLGLPSIVDRWVALKVNVLFVAIQQQIDTDDRRVV